MQDGYTAERGRVSDPSAVLRHNASVDPHGLAFREVDASGDLLTAITWAESLSRARAVAARLAAETAPGDRVLLPQNGSINFAVGLFACLEAGRIAVPTVHPRHKRKLGPLLSIAADCGARAVLAEQDDIALFEDMPLAAVAVDGPGAADWTPPAIPAPETVAFLQYTSGSTSQPKGVLIRRFNVAANAQAIVEALAVDSGSHIVSWLPLYHDMGLITGLFVPALAGASATLMPSGAFSRSPITWLRLIGQHRATHAGAPDFAFDLCTQRIGAEEAATLDLSTWRSAFLGAEPIAETTLSAFAERFAPAGFDPRAFQPCYGLAETTLLASTNRPGRGATVRTFARDALRDGSARAPGEGEARRRLVGCGAPPPGSRVAIVSPETGRVTRPGEVGEIWLSGPSVGGGYWGKPDVSRDTFQAKLDGCDHLRTGDLGFLHEGELYVSGRLKDSLILRGRTHQPHDIEAAAGAAHPDLAPGEAAAFPIETAGREGFALACALRRTSLRSFDGPSVVAALRMAVVRAAQVDPDAIVLIGPTDLPRTSSGKIRRRACAELYAADGFEALHHWTRAANRAPDEPLGADAPSPQIAAWIRRWIARRLEVNESQIASHLAFAEIGLDSMGAVELALALEIAVERLLDQTLLWSAPTISALADCVAGQAEPAASAPPRIASRARRSAVLERLRAEVSDNLT